MKQLRRRKNPVASFVGVDLQRSISRSNAFGLVQYITEIGIQSRVFVILVEAEFEKLDFLRYSHRLPVDVDGVEIVPSKEAPPELDAVEDVEKFLFVYEGEGDSSGVFVFGSFEFGGGGGDD